MNDTKEVHVSKDITTETRRQNAKALAARMTPEERRERSRKGGSMKGKKGVPRASHAGDLDIAGIKIPCAVLNGRRLISQSGIQSVFGQSQGGRKGKVATAIKLLEEKAGRAVPAPIKFAAFAPLITNDLLDKCEIVKFLHPKSGSVSYGYDYEILTDVCSLYLRARAGGALHPNQLPLVRTAEVLLEGFARVGLASLIDAATGWDAVRERDELTKILNKYIAAELQPWTRRFNPEFFKEIYRLYGWTWGDFGRTHPSCGGR